MTIAMVNKTRDMTNAGQPAAWASVNVDALVEKDCNPQDFAGDLICDVDPGNPRQMMLAVTVKTMTVIRMSMKTL